MALIGERIHEKARCFPEKEAVVHGRTVLTYEELLYQMMTLKRQCTYQLGSMKGKKISFLLPNGPEWLVVFLAVSSSGGIVIPLDPKWPKSQLDDVLLDADPDLIIYDKDLTDLSGRDHAYTWDEISIFPELELPAEQINDDDIFYIGYTSGTTGRPKGFMRAHASWADCFSEGAEVFSLKQEDRIFSPGPLVHSHFLYASIQALHLGTTLHLVSSFQAEEVWRVLEDKDITVLYIVPTMFEALKRTEISGHASYLKTMISSGAKWEKPSKRQASQLFPETDIYEFFGASELSFVSVQTVSGRNLPDGAIGTPFPQVEWSIRIDAGDEAAEGEVGMLFVKSPWIFEGYLNRPEQTAEMFDGDWATVGDLAYKNERGQVILSGRKQNMIISGGLNIYPEEVERVIRDHPAIDEVIVLGQPDSYWGEKVTAVYTGDKSLCVDQLELFCKQWLPKYKCPKEWVAVADFLYTSSGKVARKQMLDWLAEKEGFHG
ncbi:AMP-binding protein [Halobacillus litoralis]|uniref:Acyl-CoA synthetase n=1 Tax=Halobacillus litoralis TaxID=45668 RepID=A0A410MFQ7_9BACI|nr:AMP-binding protein [Halobacillus litoralis]QAS53562.1 acyl-CoA synthetase [Halobacillus litoralis]